MASEAQKILGAGVPLTVRGRDHGRLVFGFQALEVLERHFGGLLNFSDAINRGYRAERLKAVRVGIEAGFAYRDILPSEVDAICEGFVGLGFVKELDAAATAIGDAFNEAIPPEPKGRAKSKASAPASDSAGARSTDSPQSEESSPGSSEG